MSDWFYTLMGEEIGPVSSPELKQLAKSGTIDESTRIRQVSTGKTVMAGKINGLSFRSEQSLAARPAVPIKRQQTKQCPFCANQIAVQAVKCQHCGELLDPSLRAAAEARQSDRNPMVFMNAGGAAASASAASAASTAYRRPFNHLIHIVLTIVTCGMWLPVWILLFVLHKP